MSRCDECGIREKMNDSGEHTCLKFGCRISREDGGDCLYFIPIKYDDGDTLIPHQHLILKEREISSKKMRGPV